MNESMMKGQWHRIKGDLQKTWGKITGDEFEKTKGNIHAIAGLFQEKYGMAQDEAHKRLNEFLESYEKDTKAEVDEQKDQSMESH